MHGARVKASIITAGLLLWRRDPASVTARQIGKQMNMTHSAILYHFGSAEALKDAIAAHAVAVGDMIIVPQLITARHPAAAAISPADRVRYLSGC